MNKPDFNTCTLQEAADYCVFKIVEQGGACFSPELSQCVYTRESPYEEGVTWHCVVGWALPEDPAFEFCEEGVCHVVENYPELTPAVISNNLQAWRLLQMFHDTAANCKAYKNERDRERPLLERIQIFGIDTSAPHWAKWQKRRVAAGCHD